MHNITAEVVFVLDASTTVGRDNFDKQKTFVKLLARSLNVAPEKSRAALVTYSTYAFTLIPLGNYSTVQDFERILDAISFYKGERRMDRALEDAVDLFQAARPGVQRKVKFIPFLRVVPPFATAHVLQTFYASRDASRNSDFLRIPTNSKVFCAVYDYA